MNLPSEKEKETSIQFILEKGLKPKESLWKMVEDIFQSLGFRYAFYGMTDCLYLGLMLGITGIIFFSSLWGTFKEAYILSWLFTLSPFIYIFLYLLTLWKEISNKTYETKMSCKYTIKHLTAFRMICFSSIAILVNLVFSVTLFFVFDGFLFWRILLISLCGLFLFGVGMLTVLIMTNNLWIHNLWALGWIGVNSLFVFFWEAQIQVFLINIPLIFLFVFLVLAIGIYLKEIKIYLFRKEVKNQC